MRNADACGQIGRSAWVTTSHDRGALNDPILELGILEALLERVLTVGDLEVALGRRDGEEPQDASVAASPSAHLEVCTERIGRRDKEMIAP